VQPLTPAPEPDGPSRCSPAAGRAMAPCRRPSNPDKSYAWTKTDRPGLAPDFAESLTYPALPPDRSNEAEFVPICTPPRQPDATAAILTLAAEPPGRHILPRCLACVHGIDWGVRCKPVVQSGLAGSAWGALLADVLVERVQRRASRGGEIRRRPARRAGTGTGPNPLGVRAWTCQVTQHDRDINASRNMALHDRGCSRDLNPPVSRSDLAM
jgi:hypothetical protein